MRENGGYEKILQIDPSLTYSLLRAFVSIIHLPFPLSVSFPETAGRREKKTATAVTVCAEKAY